MGNQNKEEAEEDEDLGNPLKPEKDKDSSGERKKRKKNEETITEIWTLRGEKETKEVARYIVLKQRPDFRSYAVTPHTGEEEKEEEEKKEEEGEVKELHVTWLD